jgi:hypothetical protein
MAAPISWTARTSVVSARITAPHGSIAAPAVWSAGDGVLVALEGDGANCPTDAPGKGLPVLKFIANRAPASDTKWCNKVVSFSGGPIATTDGRSDPMVFGHGAYGDQRL